MGISPCHLFLFPRWGGGRHDHRKNFLGENIAGNTRSLPTIAVSRRWSRGILMLMMQRLMERGKMNEKTMRRNHAQVNGSGW